MNKQELFRRYILFACSVLMNAFSIALITKALLGTSPISSVPYVLSLFTPFTMGQYTIAMNGLFILLEMTMMKRSEIIAKRYELLAQVPVVVCFGAAIDVSMHLLQPFVPASYPVQMAALAAGCLLLGTGVSLEVKVAVSMVTGEYLVNVISKFVNRDFGLIKMYFDATLVIISVVLSLVFMHRLEGIREGTIIAAFAVGPISHWVLPCWRFLDAWLTGRR